MTAIYDKNILIVDDEETILTSVEMMLRQEGYRNILAKDSPCEALNTVYSGDIDLAVIDMNMPEMDGEDLLDGIRKFSEFIPVIVITGNEDIERVFRCTKKGVFNYLIKPVDRNRFLTSIKNALNMRELQLEANNLRRHLIEREIEHPEAFEKIITRSSKMYGIFSYLESIRNSSKPVLIRGKSGSGKELLAEAVHKLADRKGEMISINAGGLDEQVFNDTLFGHQKGAFSGAESARKGAVQSAENGTLFLDEIGDLSEQTQVKLLRLLQEGEYQALGSDLTKKTNAKIVLATSRNLEEKMENKEFREDLYYRITLQQVTIPSLNERKEDIPLLLEYFVEKRAKDYGKAAPVIQEGVYDLFAEQEFEGEIRHFEGVVGKAVVLAGDVLGLEHVRKVFEEDPKVKPAEKDYKSFKKPGSIAALFEHFPTINEASDRLVQEAMEATGDKVGEAANLLGISRQSLSKKINR
ncbi:sigma-54-dependent transcriptional regulator [Limisalsivibrio acetivorans]|uniref:sigma-54-dependent transcriptional regulator n=1 Tax=Limisalsivibrio acetivorans TaxID=1304888 RepID=UPI0003B3EEE9|nr:sigma-54 dependent transcriptional regulator [Limisalsivibrio acetivorans]